LQIVQIAGALFILTGFGLAQARLLRVEGFAYLLLNLAGGALLAVAAYAESQWGFLMLESAWVAVSAWGLLRALRRRSRLRAAAGGEGAEGDTSRA